jgi:hypothetical protein
VRDLLAPTDGVDELLLDPPADPLVGRDGDLGQGGVAPPGTGQPPGVDLDVQGTVAAEDPRLRRRRERRQRAEAQVPDRGLEVHQDVDVIRHLDLVPGPRLVLPLRLGDLGHGHHAPGRPQPAHHRLVPDAHVEDVVAAQADVLAPVHGVAELGEAPLLGALHLDGVDLAGVTLGEQLHEDAVHLERVRRRHQLGDELRRLAGGLQHLPTLGRVHRHARLAQHVLAGPERGHRQLAVHVGPGADADGIDVPGLDHPAPVGLDARDAELLGHALAGLRRPVGDGHQLDARLRLELGNVMLAGVGAGPHEPHADRFVSHGGMVSPGRAPQPR